MLSTGRELKDRSQIKFSLVNQNRYTLNRCHIPLQCDAVPESVHRILFIELFDPQVNSLHRPTDNVKFRLPFLDLSRINLTECKKFCSTDELNGLKSTCSIKPTHSFDLYCKKPSNIFPCRRKRTRGKMGDLWQAFSIPQHHQISVSELFDSFHSILSTTSVYSFRPSV